MRLITTILILFLWVSSEAQIINGSSFYRPVVSTGGSSLLLDTYTGAAAAYSLRKLRTAYSGSAIRVRRSSDNTEQDIGFTSNGDLDTSVLQTFVGYQNLLKYSEQFQQTSAWSIGANTLSSNVIESPIGTLTATKITESNATGQFYVSQNLSIASGGATISIYAKAGERSRIAVTAIITGNSRGYIFDLSNQTISSLTGFGAPDSYSFLDVGNGWYRCSVTTSLSNIVRFDIYCINNGTSRDYTGVLGNGIYIWGAQVNTNILQPYQVTTINANAGNGFIATWYDQSGNARNAAQSTAANQPRIVSSGIIQRQGSKPAINFNTTALSLNATFNGAISATHFLVGNTTASAIGLQGEGNTKYYAAMASGSSSATLHSNAGTVLLYKNSFLNTGVTRGDLYTAFSAYHLMTVFCNTSSWTGISFDLASDATYGSLTIRQEVLIYNLDQTFNKTGIESNINSYYAIY